MSRLTANKEAVSSLASICLAGDDHIDLNTGEGALFPASGDYMLRIGAGSTYEIVRATARSDDTISITRAQDGTSAIEHATGAVVWLVISYTYLSEMWAHIDAVGGRDDDDLTAGDADDFALAWLNPCAYAIWAEVMIDITVPAEGSGAVLDVGRAADATTHGDDLISGLPIGAVITYAPTARTKLAVGEYITGQILTANANDMQGKWYIRYFPV